MSAAVVRAHNRATSCSGKPVATNAAAVFTVATLTTPTFYTHFRRVAMGSVPAEPTLARTERVGPRTVNAARQIALFSPEIGITFAEPLRPTLAVLAHRVAVHLFAVFAMKRGRAVTGSVVANAPVIAIECAGALATVCTGTTPTGMAYAEATARTSDVVEAHSVAGAVARTAA